MERALATVLVVLLSSGCRVEDPGVEGEPIEDSQVQPPAEGDPGEEPVPLVTSTRCEGEVVELPPTSMALGMAAVLLRDGTVLVTGGFPSRDPNVAAVARSERFDPGTRTWSEAAPLVHPRAGHALVLLKDGGVLAVGGLAAAGDWSTELPPELYDPASATWRTTRAPQRFAHHVSLSVLADGRVMMVGNANLALGQDVVEVFDPAGERWSSLHVPHVHQYELRLSNGDLVSFNREFVWVHAADTSSGMVPHMSPFHRGTLAERLPDGRLFLLWGRYAAAYDEPTDSLTPLPYPSATWDAGQVLRLAGGRLLASDGLKVEVFDPATRRWSPPVPVAAKGAGLHSLQLALADGSALLAGTGTAALFIPGGAPCPAACGPKWRSTAPMHEARLRAATTVLLDGRVLVSGGSSAYGKSGVPLTSAEIFDPATGTWTPAQPMRAARMGHSAVRLPDGRVVVAGGFPTGFGPELFDPGTRAWTELPSPPGASSWLALAVAAGKVWALVSDASGTWLASLAVPDGGLPEASWSLGAAPRPFKSMVALEDGSLLAFGVLLQGADGAYPEYSAASERFDPRTETWIPTGPLKRSRGYPSAAVLADGRVLALEGGLFPHQSSELFDPRAGTWTEGPKTTEGRSGSTGVLAALGDGSALLVGGLDWGDAPVPRVPPSSVDRLDPVANAWTPLPMPDVGRWLYPSLAPVGSDSALMAGGGGLRGEAVRHAELFVPHACPVP